MESRLLPGSDASGHGVAPVGTKRRRRPQLSHQTVEMLHFAAWVLGVLDVILVALTFVLK